MSSPPGKETEADIKPVKLEAGEGPFVNIKVTSQTSADVFFRVRRHVVLQRLMNLYCGRHSLDPNAVHFLIDGRHIKPWQTPEGAGLEDGDSIDVMARMDGGGAPADALACTN